MMDTVFAVIEMGACVLFGLAVWYLCAPMGWEIVHMENTPYWVAA